MKVRRRRKRIPFATLPITAIGGALLWFVTGYGLPSVTLEAEQERPYSEQSYTTLVVHERSLSNANVSLYVELCEAEVAEGSRDADVSPDNHLTGFFGHWAAGVTTYGISTVVLAWKDARDGTVIRQPVIFSANGNDHVSELELRRWETNVVNLRVRVVPPTPGTYKFRVVADVRNLNLPLGLGHSRKATPLQSLQIGSGTGSHRHVFDCNE